MTHRIIIIGGGDAGRSAAWHAHLTAPQLHIDLITQAPGFQVDGITIHDNVEITSISPGVIETTKSSFAWDRLVITPEPLSRGGLEGVFLPFISMDQLLSHVDEGKVVIHATSGKEIQTAFQLREKGFDVLLFHKGEWLLAPLVDEQQVSSIEAEIRDRGIQLVGSVTEYQVQGEDVLEGVTIGDESISCDLFIEGEPQTTPSFIDNLGVKMDAGRIQVDDSMLCQDDFWAAGSFTKVHDDQYSISTTFHEKAQGRVAGVNAVGSAARYDSLTVPWGWKIGEITLGGVGVGEAMAAQRKLEYVVGEATGISKARYYPGFEKVQVKLITSPEGKLLGGRLSGVEGILERCDFIALALRKGATLHDIESMENVYSPPIGALKEPMASAAEDGLSKIHLF